MTNKGSVSLPRIFIGFVTALVMAQIAACSDRAEPANKAHAAQSPGGVPWCSSGTLVQVELEAWQQRLEAMPHWPIVDGEPELSMAEAPDYNVAIGEMGLDPLPDRSMEALTAERAVMALTSIEIVYLRRGAGIPPDSLVIVRFVNADGAQSLRAVVLRPVPGQDDTFCALGDELSHEKESGEEPCSVAYSGTARSFKVVPLVTENRDAIAVYDAGGWCGDGSRRGDKFVTSYWGVEQGQLVQYFQAVTAESWYQSPYPPTADLRGAVDLTGGWPKTINHTETRECLSVDGYAGSDDDCKAYKRARLFQYADGEYTELKD